MAKRHRMNRRASARNFRRGNHISNRNVSPPPMRGGFRL